MAENMLFSKKSRLDNVLLVDHIFLKSPSTISNAHPIHIYACTYIVHANINHVNKISVSNSRFLQQLGTLQKIKFTTTTKMLAIACFWTKILLSILMGSVHKSFESVQNQFVRYNKSKNKYMYCNTYVYIGQPIPI